VVGEGFWSICEFIANALARNKLLVILMNGEAVAFRVGLCGEDIVNVRKNKRRIGFGTSHFYAAVERAKWRTKLIF
jgi:hypothetical protein